MSIRLYPYSPPPPSPPAPHPAGAFVIAWKRGIAILTAGSVKVTPDSRVGLVDGHYLQIENAVPQDGGEYVCQIATLEPIEITHLVDILGRFNTTTTRHSIPGALVVVLPDTRCRRHSQFRIQNIPWRLINSHFQYRP